MKILASSLVASLAIGSWSYDVGGSVTDGRGSPLAGVTMTLRQGSTTLTAQTNSVGAYAFTGLSAADYSLVPTGTGRFFSPESVFLSALDGNRTLGFEGSSTSSTWVGMDVGSPLQQGTTTTTATGIRMTGFGALMDVGSSYFADNLHTYTRGFTGDGEFIAKLSSFSGGGEDARFGLVFRESMAPSARFAALVVRPNHPEPNERIKGYSRQTPGRDAFMNCTNSCYLGTASPTWLKVRRQGSQFLFSVSNNGVDWIYQGFTVVPMAKSARVGFFITGDDSTSQTATVDQISLTSNATPSVALSSSATDVVAGTPVALSATATDADGSVQSVAFFVNGELVGSSLRAPYQVTWPTTGLPAGRYLAMAKVLDDKGAYLYSKNLPITLTGAVPTKPVALLVVRSTTLAPQDLAVRDRLSALGFTVQVKTDASVALADAEGSALVVAGPTASASNLGTKLVGATKPVLVLNPALYPAFQMTGQTSGTHWGWTASARDLKVTGCSGSYLDWSAQGNVQFSNETKFCHELTAGLFGDRQVLKASRPLAWAKPASSAKIAATATNDASKALLFGYDQGAALFNGSSASGKRVGLWMDSLGATAMTDLGYSMFDAAAYWAAGLRTPITKKVYVLNFDPILESKGGLRTHAYKGWNDASPITRDYLNDLTEASGGYVRWKLVDFRTIDGSPRMTDGTFHSDDQIIAAIDKRQYTAAGTDYNWIADQYSLDAFVSAGQVDEVVVWGYPGIGMCESRMLGPTPYWVNCGELYRANSTRNYVVMGLNYERNQGEALESFGHRVESILRNATGGWTNSADCSGKPDFRDRSLWDLFTNYQKMTPAGDAASVGNVHFNPTAPQDYDWDPRWSVANGTAGAWRTTYSFADDWARNYPNLVGLNSIVDTRTWDPAGGTEYLVLDRNYKKWWLGHLPRVLGNVLDGTPTERLSQVARGFAGFRNNWWDYIVDFNVHAESKADGIETGCLQAFDLPDAPYGLTATAGASVVDLSWYSSYGATSYVVEFRPVGGTWSQAGTTTSTTFRVTGLTNGTTYAFRLRTVGASGTGLPGSEQLATPVSNSEPCSPATIISSGHSGNFNTTKAVCFKTSENIVGWGCTGFDGRIVKVNGVQVACGQLPLAPKVGGFNYFEVTAGPREWANFWWW